MSSPSPSLPAPLLHNLLLFGRVLRRVGIPVTTSQVLVAVRSLDFIDIGRLEDVRSTLRCVFLTRHDDLATFDRAFDAFWRPVGPHGYLHPVELPPLHALTESVVPSVAPGTRGVPYGSDILESDDASGDQESGDATGGIGIYSDREVLRHRDFALLTDDELADARRALARMRWIAIQRRSRRLKPSKSGNGLDMRRTVRRSLTNGGELIHLAHRAPAAKRRRVVLLCDISGSMDRYSRLLLHFMHALERGMGRTEVFVFGTRLTRITRSLSGCDPDAAVAAAAAQVLDWAGGTRIGDALGAFNRCWARRVLGHGAVVVIISDGWDRGDPDLLAAEMCRLRRASYRLVWLNPLLGNEGYRPLTQGIQAALPYVDDFLPAHNIASLESLAQMLESLGYGQFLGRMDDCPERRHPVRQTMGNAAVTSQSTGRRMDHVTRKSQSVRRTPGDRAGKMQSAHPMMDTYGEGRYVRRHDPVHPAEGD